MGTTDSPPIVCILDVELLAILPATECSGKMLQNTISTLNNTSTGVQLAGYTQ